MMTSNVCMKIVPLCSSITKLKRKRGSLHKQINFSNKICVRIKELNKHFILSNDIFAVNNKKKL